MSVVKFIYYRLQTKLREGNVLIGVYLSFCSGGPHVTIIHDALRHEYPSPQITDMGPTATDSGGHHWTHWTYHPRY